MQGSIHDASGGVGVGGLVMETLDDMQLILPLVTAADQTETGRYWSVKVKFDVTSSLWHARDSFIKIIFPYIDNKSKYKQGNPTVEAIYL